MRGDLGSPGDRAPKSWPPHRTCSAAATQIRTRWLDWALIKREVTSAYHPHGLSCRGSGSGCAWPDPHYHQRKVRRGGRVSSNTTGSDLPA